MTARSRRGEAGVVGVILALVIVFALVAVVELTRTLQAAQDINLHVIDITGSVKGANSHLNTGCSPSRPCTDTLPVLSQTETIVAQINDAAKPLSGQAAEILSNVNSINSTASQILATATSINGTVHSINTVAGTINTSVHAIAGSIAGVNSTVLGIRGAPGVGIIGINNRADTVINLVEAIKSDTGTIAGQAGGILAQAHAIACDRVLGVTVPLSSTC
jgi:flagellin-like protein